MKARAIVKWAIGAVALVVLIAVCGVVSLFVAFYMDMEKGERHRCQFQAELDSGRWDFGQQPALFAVAQGIVRNDPNAIRTAAKSASGAFPANAQIALCGIHDALVRGRETRDRPANPLDQNTNYEFQAA